MKKWKCLVCGYVHEGDSPPERCPKCGAPKEKFVLISDSDGQAESKVTGLSGESFEADVLVVGSGAAAFSAAITARNEGAEVIMLEKAEMVGGTTIRSGGGFWIPNNRHQKELGIEDKKEDAMKYMARYSFPHLYNPNDPRLGLPDNEYKLIEAMYDNAAKAVEYLEGCGVFESIPDINWTGKAQVDYQDHLPENKGIRGRTLFSKDSKGQIAYGFDFVNYLETWAKAKGIRILLNHEVTRIVQDDNKKVIGLEVKVDGASTQFFKARKGVIFGSGGYSHNPELMLHFQRGPHFGGCSAPTNTGDFIKMAAEIGAKLGNMAGAFRAQSVIESVIADPGGSNNVFYILGDSIIIVNKYGKRVVDEKRNYTDRTMVHFEWDAQRAEWTNMLLFLIYDDRTARLWNGFPPFIMQGDNVPSYMIRENTIEDLSAEISRRLESISEHTGSFALSDEFTENLKSTIKLFNDFAKTGTDEDFHRGEFAYDREWTTFPPYVPGDEKWPPEGSKNYTMYPISEEGPYYAIILGAGTLDTNGGPVINSKAQVLDWNGNPIQGLYGAGNCIASPTANAYWGGGSTIGPGLTFGHIAALDVLKE
jgi:3-oxosteroid 1-dehydrogenase